jgi:hypothetical protein
LIIDWMIVGTHPPFWAIVFRIRVNVTLRAYSTEHLVCTREQRLNSVGKTADLRGQTC